MIIDAHAHCDVRFGWVHTPEVLIRVMDEGGIDKACITGLADIPGDDAGAYPRFVADAPLVLGRRPEWARVGQAIRPAPVGRGPRTPEADAICWPSQGRRALAASMAG